MITLRFKNNLFTLIFHKVKKKIRLLFLKLGFGQLKNVIILTINKN